MNLRICHKCQFRQRGCQGPCVCTVDGRDIIEHATSGQCPKGYFDGVPQIPLHQPASAALSAIPRDQWPWAARLIANRARPGEAGVGDTLARLLGIVGGELYKWFYIWITGADCGCGDRQARLNALYPFDPEGDSKPV